MEYPYNGILLGKKKEWTTDACNDMDKSQDHYAEWKKPGTKEDVLYYWIYMTFWEGGKMKAAWVGGGDED